MQLAAAAAACAAPMFQQVGTANAGEVTADMRPMVNGPPAPDEAEELKCHKHAQQRECVQWRQVAVGDEHDRKFLTIKAQREGKGLAFPAHKFEGRISTIREEKETKRGESSY